MKVGPYELNSIVTGNAFELIKAIPDNSIDLVVTSPPYNCRKEYGEFDDQIPWPVYYRQISGLLYEIYRGLVVGGVVAINIPGVVAWQQNHRYQNTWGDFDKNYKTHRNGKNFIGRGRIEPVGFNILQMMKDIDCHIREPIVWVKGTDGNAISDNYKVGSDCDPHLRATHEFILLGSKGRWFHRGGTGRRGREVVPAGDYMKDTWFLTPARDQKHPAVFPIELPERLINIFTHAPDSIVLDPFIGIGTTAKAAQKTKRKYIGFELDPLTAERARERTEYTKESLL